MHLYINPTINHQEELLRGELFKLIQFTHSFYKGNLMGQMIQETHINKLWPKAGI